MPINSFVDYPMTWRPDKKGLKRPLYLSLASLLEQDIEAGHLPPGTKLPPQRELADFLDVNFTTITRAYKIGETKGLIYAVTGSGTFVSPNAARSVTISKETSTADGMDLAFVASFEQSNAMVTAAAKKVMDKSYLVELLNYNHPTGMPHHKLAGMRWMETFGITAEAEHMAVISGAQNALAIVLLALFEPGNRIAVDVFTYANFIEAAKMCRIQLVPIPGDAEGMLPHELETQCRLLDLHGVFLMPSCSNPTTVTMTVRRKKELAAVIRERQLIVIEDDIYAFLTAGTAEEDMLPLFRLLPEQTVYICGTSKSICSGLRVAYMVYGQAFKKQLEKALFNVNVKTSSLDAEIITELIVSGRAEEIVQKKKQLAAAANQLFSSYFPQTSGSGHPLSFYRWLPIECRDSAEHVEGSLQKLGVRVLHSDRFLSGAPVADKFLRIALASTKSEEELEMGLEILKKYLS